MKKNGFTLAEVLITLGIIGVIASITLPGLTVNIQKQQTGPALAKAINTLETANALALQRGGVRSLEQLLPSSNVTAYFSGCIDPYVQWRKDLSLKKPYYQYNVATAYSFGSYVDAYTSKDGITFLHAAEGPSSLSADSLKTLGLGYSGKYYTVYIDTNGHSKGPNALGKDFFQVLVDTKGTVIPYGGTAWSAYTGKAVKWSTGCYTNKKHPTDALSCAGSIADNGFKVIY